MSLAATWDTDLVHRIGNVVAYEALAKHWQAHSNALSFFAPNINIVRDVRWGRAQETYGGESARLRHPCPCCGAGVRLQLTDQWRNV
jgi:beta-glucosidase-like glycosyl hydrolase